jgi:NAD(P)-dependent dehydrogenase (short-subunit alcohol dehydrogenase family)
MAATALLRPGLLEGSVVALGGGSDAFDPSLAALGARTLTLPTTLDEETMAAAVDPATRVLVHDLRPAFADGLRATLDLAWVTVRAVANAAFIPDARGGKMTLIAPAPDDAQSAVAGVRAAAENLARTLSIEWARHGVTTVAITPGTETAADELAALTAYLASPAGDYFSGCRLALGEVALTA